MNKLKTLILGMGIIISPSFFAQNSTPDYKIDFEGRTIDIRPYLEDFPYSQFSLSKDGDKLFFHNAGDQTHLQWIDLTKTTDLNTAKNAIDVDLAKANCWHPKYNKADDCLYWIGDENNEEIINIYRSKLGSTEKEKLTDVPYIYAWNFNQDHSKIAYVSRMGQNESRLDELHVLDLKTKEDKLIGTDKSDFRYTWGSVSWRPDNSGVMLLALKNMDRHYANVLYIDLKTGERTVLTDSEKLADYSGTEVMDEWIDNDKCLFFSNTDGFKNIYTFNANTKKVSQLTKFKTDIDNVDFVTVKNKKYLFGLQMTPVKTDLFLMEPETGKILYTKSSPYALSIGAVKDNKVTLLANNVTTPIKVITETVGKKKMTESTILDLPQELQDKLVSSNVEELSIPTFDIDPATGKQRLLHAYLFKPKNPLPKDKQLCMIESFYGGDNRYDEEYQIYTNAGIYVLSPSPRGSSGFGRDFAALNDKDLGGNETIDIINCAKFISKKLNIPENHVGCFGVSHGGYETMRLMTFPGEINDNKASFPFGFGVETAGFCDIIYEYYHCNIPDWITLEAGDPVTEKAKLVDRSPLYHADKLTGSLLLVHGNHDNRVDIEGSRLMDRMLTQLGLPHKYVEFEGLGHGVKGKENNLRFYKEVFSFLEGIN